MRSLLFFFLFLFGCATTVQDGKFVLTSAHKLPERMVLDVSWKLELVPEDEFLNNHISRPHQAQGCTQFNHSQIYGYMDSEGNIHISNFKYFDIEFVNYAKHHSFVGKDTGKRYRLLTIDPRGGLK